MNHSTQKLGLKTAPAASGAARPLAVWLTLLACAQGGHSNPAPTAAITRTDSSQKLEPPTGGQASVDIMRVGLRVTAFDPVKFSSPSAVTYDSANDLYWVSNSRGAGAKAEGYISRLEPSGRLATLNFATGRDAPAKGLVDPRGLAARGRSLYVADHHQLWEFDTSSGATVRTIPVAGSTRLHGVTAAADGTVYVTDIGQPEQPFGYSTEVPGALYRLSDEDILERMPTSTPLFAPLAVLASGEWLGVTLGSQKALASISLRPGQSDPFAVIEAPAPTQMTHGLIEVPDGRWLLSSTTEGSIYYGDRGGPYVPLLTNLEGPGQIGYDMRRHRLLIPLVTGHALAIFRMPGFSSEAVNQPVGLDSP